MTLSPKQVGQYSVIGDLGVGYSGKVKLAEHTETGKKVALKFIKKSNLKDQPDLELKVKREISLMSIFNHPHILRLVEVFENDKYLYLATEYAENGDLFEYIVQGHKPSEEEAISYFRQVIYALEILHQHNVCHRDLKLENILIDSSQSLKLADFGFSTWSKDDRLSSSCGSPHYAAPEVLKGGTYSGKKADIWSAGVILYILITVCIYLFFFIFKNENGAYYYFHF